VTYKLGTKVDPSGELPDGRTFAGPQELAHLLTSSPDQLARAFTAHLSRYATGAEVSYADRAEVRRIVESTKSNGYGMRSLIHALARSEVFIEERAERSETDSRRLPAGKRSASMGAKK
jgi:hypothetical protein